MKTIKQVYAKATKPQGLKSILEEGRQKRYEKLNPAPKKVGVAIKKAIKPIVTSVPVPKGKNLSVKMPKTPKSMPVLKPRKQIKKRTMYDVI